MGLNELEQQIEQTKLILVHQLEKRTAFLEQINHEHDPFQRLPYEITSYIFMLCLPHVSSLDMFDAMVKTSARPMPLLLGSICRHWRKTAWATPQLWNVLSLRITHANLTWAWNDLVAEWLGRSGQYPLYILVSNHISLVYHDPGGPVDMTRAVIRTVSQYASRWRVLYIRYLSPTILGDLCHASHSVQGILESLTVEVSREGCPTLINNCRGRSSCRSEKASPKRVKLVDSGWDTDGLCWDNVTFLELRLFTSTEALSILRRAPRLEELRLSALNNVVMPSITRIALPFLHTIYLCPWSITLLHYISCPNLKNVLVGHKSLLVPLVNFIDVSACPLANLTISSCHTVDDFRLLFRSTPSLTRLNMTAGTNLPHGFFQLFASTSGAAGGIVTTNEVRILPSLCEFILGGYKDFDWPSVSLLLVGRPISKISILWSGTFIQVELPVIGKDDMTDILRFIGLGVKIEVTGESGKDMISLSRQLHEL